MHTIPDPATLQTVLQLAARAPSVHNTQPWRWQVRATTLELFADPPRRPPDPDGRDLILSCGAALNHCVIALAALGFHARVRRLPDPARPDHLASIELVRRAAEPVDVMLAAAIPRRRTDRRCYSDWPVPAADVALMGARAARTGVMLRQVDALDRLNAVVAAAVRPPRGLGGPAPGRPFGAEPAVDRAVMLALGTADDDPLARLRAGEATSVVLLTATALGLASCPVTEPLAAADTRAVVRRDVFGTSGHPQLLLRVGWAPINADPLPATPRRPLSGIVDFGCAAGQRAPDGDPQIGEVYV